MFEMKKDFGSDFLPGDNCSCSGYAGTVNNFDEFEFLK